MDSCAGWKVPASIAHLRDRDLFLPTSSRQGCWVFSVRTLNPTNGLWYFTHLITPKSRPHSLTRLPTFFHELTPQ
eukprot:12048982-Alexandrium_andersonii.AAC.1